MATNVSATVDNTTVTLVAKPEDDHGDPTPDTLAWTNDDTAAAVAAWSFCADAHTYTGTLAHTAEGTVTVTVSDPSASGVAPAEVVLTVGPGATSKLAVTATVVLSARAVSRPAAGVAELACIRVDWDRTAIPLRIRGFTPCTWHPSPGTRSAARAWRWPPRGAAGHQPGRGHAHPGRRCRDRPVR